MIELLFAAEDSGAGEAAGVTFAIWFILVVIGFYFLPTIVGLVRRVRNIGSLIVVNLFLGWTLVGWVVALAMSLRTVDDRAF